MDQHSNLIHIIKEILNSENSIIFHTKSIEDNIIKAKGKNFYINNGDYLAFAKAIQFLLDSSFLKPVSPKLTNRLNPELPIRIRKVKKTENKKKLAEQLQNLMKTIHPAISLGHYKNNLHEIDIDLPLILKICSFLNENKNYIEISMNERSFQIFNDEKFLASYEGEALLKKINLNFSRLFCYKTYEPFFYYFSKNYYSYCNFKEYNAIIIENKDTFFSLKKLMMNGKYFLNNIPYDILIYGEGKKIEKSISFIHELNLENIQFSYFGDLDPEGISILYRLLQNNKYNISPNIILYKELIFRFQQKARIINKQQQKENIHLEFFYKYFDIEFQIKVINMFKNNLYLPQEALSKDILEELFQ